MTFWILGIVMSSVVIVNIAHMLTFACLYTTINGKTLHFVFSFLHKGLLSGSDIYGKFHQGSDGNCQT